MEGLPGTNDGKRGDKKRKDATHHWVGNCTREESGKNLRERECVRWECVPVRQVCAWVLLLVTRQGRTSSRGDAAGGRDLISKLQRNKKRIHKAPRLTRTGSQAPSAASRVTRCQKQQENNPDDRRTETPPAAVVPGVPVDGGHGDDLRSPSGSGWILVTSLEKLFRWQWSVQCCTSSP